MKKEILINKWLDSEIDEAELQELKKIPEYESYAKLCEKATLFKDDSYNVDLEYKNLSTLLKEQKSTQNDSKVKTLNTMLKPFLRIAAIFILGISVYYLPIYDDFSTVKTLADQQKTIELPDASVVSLEKESSLRFQKGSWDAQRKVNLVGEAHFKVSKGSTFDVQTWLGKITVLGTEFKVVQRTNYFEIICFEGMVSFDYKGKTVKLPAGKSLRIIDGKIISKHETKLA